MMHLFATSTPQEIREAGTLGAVGVDVNATERGRVKVAGV
jgi:hypothetical protein